MTHHSRTRHNSQSVDSDEITYFDALADEWWNPKGVFAALQRMTPVRVEYIRRHAGRCLQQSYEARLEGLTVIDIGCGGGLLAEPLTRLGAKVVGLDASKEAITSAKNHASAQELSIEYHAKTAESFAKKGKSFDIIIASEVIEHVADRPGFFKTLASFGHADKPSLVILTTINRSAAGVLLGKYVAEYVLGLIPKGAHDPKRFVRPQEMKKEARDAGILIDDITGIRLAATSAFGTINFTLGGPPLINYAAAGIINNR